MFFFSSINNKRGNLFVKLLYIVHKLGCVYTTALNIPTDTLCELHLHTRQCINDQTVMLISQNTVSKVALVEKNSKSHF